MNSTKPNMAGIYARINCGEYRRFSKVVLRAPIGNRTHRDKAISTSIEFVLDFLPASYTDCKFYTVHLAVHLYPQ